MEVVKLGDKQMNEELTKADIALIIESFKYSKLNIENGSAPDKIKNAKRKQIEEVEKKLREIRDTDK